MSRPALLFVHDFFPAQFGPFARWLAARGWRVGFATASLSAGAPGIRMFRYAQHREPSPQTHPYAQPLDRASLRAQAFARTMFEARRDGFEPDIVMAHAGWGAGMFAKDVFPEARSVPLAEWWYRTPAPDAAFLSRGSSEGKTEAPPSLDIAMLQNARNAPTLFGLAGSDMAFCPTRFQAVQFPARLRPLLSIIHDGVDTALHAPSEHARTSTLSALVPADAEVVTYATRGQEPHRGFPQFMRALPAIFAARPRAHAVVVGDNVVAYGDPASRMVDWRALTLSQTMLDPSRIHFTGALPRSRYIEVLRRSNAHVYLTAPFVLSWSMLEAMSIGAPLIASDTEPVREFAVDGLTASLVDFFDSDALAAAVISMLEQPDRARRLGEAARDFVRAEVSAEVLWPRKEQMLLSLIGG